MKSIREVLSPLLILSYVSGLRLWIIELPTYYLRPWFNIVYMLLFWLIYCFLLKFASISGIPNETKYLICFWLDIFITLVSVVLGVYHNKKFSNCLKKLEIVDDTLLKIGITTDHHKLHKKTIWLVLGWLVTTIILMNYGMALWMTIEYNYDILTYMYIFFITKYPTYISMIDDLIFGSILGYIRLKFDQINRYFLNLTEDNKWKVNQVSKNVVLLSHQHKFLEVPTKELITWIIIHLHLELRRISYDINSIFETQMTLKMIGYFLWLALDLHEIFSIIFINNYIKYNVSYTIIMLFWTFLSILKLFFINYMCETVSEKANATGNLINKMPYFTCSVAIRENISQFLLQMTQMPVRFCGIGFFQFGYKFLQGFVSSITTVLVLLTQEQINRQTTFQNIAK